MSDILKIGNGQLSLTMGFGQQGGGQQGHGNGQSAEEIERAESFMSDAIKRAAGNLGDLPTDASKLLHGILADVCEGVGGGEDYSDPHP